MFRNALPTTLLVAALLAVGAVPAAMASEGSFEPAARNPTLRITGPASGGQSTGVALNLTLTRNGQTQTQQIIAILIGLLTSPRFDLGSYPSLPAQSLTLADGKVVVEASLDPLYAHFARIGWQVTGVSPSNPPTVVAAPAEGKWVGALGRWICELEDTDTEWCNGLCGGEANVDSLDTEPLIASNNPMMEPTCKTTCKCKPGHGNGGSRQDPPALDASL